MNFLNAVKLVLQLVHPLLLCARPVAVNGIPLSTTRVCVPDAFFAVVGGTFFSTSERCVCVFSPPSLSPFADAISTVTRGMQEEEKTKFHQKKEKESVCVWLQHPSVDLAFGL